MKPNRIPNHYFPMALAGAIVLALTMAYQAAADSIRYEAVTAESKCKMAGTSSMHDWTMQSGMVLGSMEVEADFPESALTNAAAAKPVTQVGIPVRSFKSSSPTMEPKMQGHLKAAKFPKIEYRLLELKPVSPPDTKGALKFNAVGALTIAGATVTNTMPVTIEKKDGKLRVIGSTSVKMSDHGLEPYKFLLISTGDELQITFDWVFARRQNSPSAESKTYTPAAAEFVSQAPGF